MEGDPDPKQVSTPYMERQNLNLRIRMADAGAIGLDEGFAEPSRDHALLGLADIGQGVVYPVDPAALPGGAHDAADEAVGMKLELFTVHGCHERPRDDRAS